MSAMPETLDQHLMSLPPAESSQPLADWLEGWARTVEAFGSLRCQWLAGQVRELADNARLFGAESPREYDERLEMLTQLTEQAVRAARLHEPQARPQGQMH